MAFTVRFTTDARKDLRAIHAYIAENDSPASADHVAQGIVRAALGLRELPLRGVYPPEMLAKGNQTYRQIFFKPYRILYRIHAHTVFIGLIADGRRNLAPLLARRLHKS